MDARPHIFISATSADLRDARDRAAKAIHTLGGTPVWEDTFPTDGGDLRQVLRDKIDPCQLLLQLVGHRYGAEPRVIDPAHGRVSYTQFEARYARERKIKVIYLLLAPAYPTAACPPEPDALRHLQLAYRQSILASDDLFHGTTGGRDGIPNPVELENHVLKIPLPVAQEPTERLNLPWSPPPRARGFAGRVEDLAQVTDLLKRERSVALTGPGGMGKTALAAEVICQLAPEPGPRSRWPGGIYSHDYYRESSHPSALTGLLGQAGIDLRQVTDATGEVRRLFSQPGVLLYLEGCEKAEDLTALLDLTGRSQVLLTTRDKVKRGDAHAFEVQPLDEKSAAQLLNYHAGRTQLPDLPANPAPATPPNPAASGLPLPVRHERGEGRGEGAPQPGQPTSPQPSPPAAGGEGDRAPGSRKAQLQLLVQQRPAWAPWLKLARELGGHPLALRLAGAWMHDQHESPEEFAASQATERFGDWSQRDQRKDNLHRLFRHSADAVSRKHPLALEVWYALALHGHAPVPLPVLCACVAQPETDVRKALAALVNYSLAERGNFPAETIGQTEPAWQLTHALLGEWPREKWWEMRSDGPTGGSAEHHSARPERGLQAASTSADPSGLKRAEARAPVEQAVQCSALRCEAIFNAWHLWWHGHLDQCFRQRAVPGGPDRYLALQPHWHSLLHLTERRLGGHSTDVANMLDKFASAHQYMGNFLVAEPLYRRALEVNRRTFGAEHPETFRSLNGLAGTLRSKGDLAGAEPIYRQLLEISERVLGEEHPQTLASVNNFASLLRLKGDWATAERLFRQTLSISERVLGHEHPQTLGCVNNLAVLLNAKGDLGGAEPLLRRSLVITEHLLGSEHAQTLGCINNLAVLLRGMGDLDRAEHLFRKVVDVRQRTMGDEHPGTLVSVNNLAELLRDKGDLAGAEPLIRRTLEIRERIFGEEHPDTLTSRINLAGLIWLKGELKLAEALFRRVLAVQERLNGDEHRDTLVSISNLASLLQDKGDLDGAEALYRRVLEGQERILGAEHPDTLTSVNNLAGLLNAKADQAGAEPLFRRMVAVRERVLGGEHPQTLASINNLAAFLCAKGDLAGAEPLYRRALAVSERVLGAEHSNTLISVDNLAQLLEAKGDRAKAEPLYRRALEGCERLLGTEHPGTLTSVNNLAGLLYAKGDLAGAERLFRRALNGCERLLGVEHPNTLTSPKVSAIF